MDLKQSRFLVTPISYGRADPRLKTDLEDLVGEVVYNAAERPLSSAEVARLLRDVDAYIAGLDTIDRAALDGANRLRVIARYGVGMDSVDLDAARERGIVVTNTPGANSVSVAELALALILTLARSLPEAMEATRHQRWPRIPGVSLEGKTIGIIGFGSIGKKLALRLAGFDCRILAYDPNPDAEYASAHHVELQSLDETLRQADFVSLHLPLLPETRGMVDDKFLAKTKKGAYLVNTSRGDVVEEGALVEALKSGHLSGAALDTFKIEPPGPGNPLLGLSQVIATPHLGAQTDGAINRMGWMALRDCLAVLRGESPLHRVA
jgi:D-3-phosphoglycerate dehydrogenase